MSIPQFTAQASLYRTRRHYRGLSSDLGGLLPGEPIVPAYFPGSGTQHDCSTCLESAVKGNYICVGPPTATAAAVCLTSSWFTFGISCAAAVAGAAIALELCSSGFLIATGVCMATTCCPKLCGVPNPLDPGSGCCDEGEACVDQNDPNSRQGCCPRDQNVCAGKCCAKGESCCGDTCCPPDYFCRDGFCSEFPGSIIPDNPKAPTDMGTFREKIKCPPGSERCGTMCCPPGLQCCDLGAGRVGCMDNCYA